MVGASVQGASTGPRRRCKVLYLAIASLLACLLATLGLVYSLDVLVRKVQSNIKLAEGEGLATVKG
jgi:hypothetical protein